MPKLLLLSLCLINFLTAHSGSRTDYYFKQLSLDEGLSQSTVRCVLKDSRGYLWIGTKSGLNKYDTYELTVYKNSLKTPFLLPSNHINFLTEDKDGLIWVGTEAGTCIYNYKDDSFANVLIDGENVRLRSFLHIENSIIFGGPGKLYEYCYASKKTIPLVFSNIPRLHDNIIFTDKWDEDHYIIGTRREGLWLYNRHNHNISEATFCEYKDIICYYLDNDKNLWLSPYGKGIVSYDRNGNITKRLNSANKLLDNDIVLDIEMDKDDNIWVATDGSGISIIDRKSWNTSKLEYIPGNSFSFPANSVMCVYKDDDENIWAGTIRAGLVGIKKVDIRTFKDAPPYYQYGLSEKTVLQVIEDKDGSVWIGTDGGGINRFDNRTNSFTHYSSTSKMKIVSSAEFDNDQLIISCFAKGLYLFNKKTGKLTPFTITDDKIKSEFFLTGISVNLLSISNKLYIFSDQIYLYDKNYKTIAVINNDSIKSKHSLMQKLSRDEKHIYLVGSNQILTIDTRTNSISVLYKAAPDTSINTVAEGDENDIWIGTDKGLMLFLANTKRINEIETNLFKEVSSLVFGPKGRLWIGAREALYAYSPDTKKFTIFGESDGAFPNEYLSKPALLGSDGSVYMGGVKGLLQISNGIRLNDSEQPPSMALSKLQIDGIDINIQARDKTVEIPWSHNITSLRIITKDKDLFQERAYKYIVSGHTQDTIETYSKQIILSKLPVGNYSIKVSCSTRSGEWSKEQSLISFYVYPPWWRSTWFILLCVGILILIAFLFIRFILLREERKIEQEKREYEKEAYESKIRFLINISHELRTPLTLIYAPLKRLLETFDNSQSSIYRQLKLIMKQTLNMRNIINMVLDMRRIEMQGDVLNLEEYGIKEWINEVVFNFSGEFQANDIKPIVLIDSLIKSIVFDKGKSDIILSNLLMNALKHSDKNSKVTITAKQEGDHLKICVIDEGAGLYNVDIDKLFNRFYKGDHSAAGSGIGLSYSKQLVQIQGGAIGAQNNEIKGACFWFTLPLNRKAAIIPQINSFIDGEGEIAAIAYDSPQLNEVKTGELSNYTLLVVEDSDDLRTFLKETLARYLKEVYVSCDGQQALELIKIKQPDIVISDIMMPNMDGFELCRRIKEDIAISHTPVILLTARTDKHSASIGYKLGADAYISKPFDMEDLIAIINNQLRTREKIKERYLYSNLIVDPLKATFSNPDENFILKLNDLIEKNISNSSLNVDFVSRHMAMSRASLYNKFKAIIGLGISDYITHYRIEYAANLLINTDSSIGEIAFMVGFNDQRYFSTVFKDLKGSPPSSYRELNK